MCDGWPAGPAPYPTNYVILPAVSVASNALQVCRQRGRRSPHVTLRPIASMVRRPG